MPPNNDQLLGIIRAARGRVSLYGRNAEHRRTAYILPGGGTKASFAPEAEGVNINGGHVARLVYQLKLEGSPSSYGPSRSGAWLSTVWTAPEADPTAKASHYAYYFTASSALGDASFNQASACVVAVAETQAGQTLGDSQGGIFVASHEDATAGGKLVAIQTCTRFKAADIGWDADDDDDSDGGEGKGDDDDLTGTPVAAGYGVVTNCAGPTPGMAGIHIKARPDARGGSRWHHGVLLRPDSVDAFAIRYKRNFGVCAPGFDPLDGLGARAMTYVGIGLDVAQAPLHLKGPIALEGRFESSQTVSAPYDLGRLSFWGRGDFGTTAVEMARGHVQVTDPTHGHERAEQRWSTRQDGTVAERMRLGLGLYDPAAAGGDKGAGSINFRSVYIDGTLALGVDTSPPAVPSGFNAPSQTLSVSPGGTQQVVVAWSWTANTETDLAGYVVALKRGSGPFRTVKVEDAAFECMAIPGETLQIKVAAHDTQHNKSAFSSPYPTSPYVVTGDGAVPTGTVTVLQPPLARPKAVVMTASQADANFGGFALYVSDNGGADTALGVFTGRPGKPVRMRDETGYTIGHTLAYKAAPVNQDMVESPTKTTLGSVTFAGVKGADIEAAAVDFSTHVSGATKPANNATVGSTVGTDLKDPNGTSLAMADVHNAAATFAARKRWAFKNSLQGWTVNGASSANAALWVTVTGNVANQINFVLTGISMTGADIYRVRVRLRPKQAIHTWSGRCFYATSGHGISTSFFKQLALPANWAVNEWRTLEWDMSALNAGGTDFTDNTIITLNFDLGQTIGDAWDVAWAAVGDDGGDPVGVRGISDNADVTGTNLARGALVDASAPSTNSAPSVYRALGVSVLHEQKTRSTISAPGSATNGTLITKVFDAAVNGAQIIQRFDSGDGMFRRRSAVGDDTTWGVWKRDYSDDQKPKLGGDIQSSSGSTLNDADVITAQGHAKGTLVDTSAASTDSAPSVYRALGGVVRYEQKNRANISAPGSASTGALTTKVTQTATGAGTIHQEFVSADGRFKRRNVDETSWTSWKQAFDEEQLPTTANVSGAGNLITKNTYDLTDIMTVNNNIAGQSTTLDATTRWAISVRANNGFDYGVTLSTTGASGGDRREVSCTEQSTGNVIVSGSTTVTLVPGTKGIWVMQTGAFILREVMPLVDVVTGQIHTNLLNNAHIKGYSRITTDASASFTFNIDGPTIYFDTPIAAARNLDALIGTGSQGSRMRFVRTANATGAFNLNIRDGATSNTRKALAAASTWCELEWNGATFLLTAAGTL